MQRVPRVAHRAQPRMLARGAETEFREPGLAQRNQAGGEIRPGEVTVGRFGPRFPGIRATHGRHALDGDVVLDESRDAVEEPAEGAGCGAAGMGPVEGLERQPVEGGIDRLHPRDSGLDQIGGRYPAGSQFRHQAHGIVLAQGVIAKCTNTGRDISRCALAAGHAPTLAAAVTVSEPRSAARPDARRLCAVRRPWCSP